jgi:hypothetical protein
LMVRGMTHQRYINPWTLDIHITLNPWTLEIHITLNDEG